MKNSLAILSMILVLGCSANHQQDEKIQDKNTTQKDNIAETETQVPKGLEKAQKIDKNETKQATQTGYLVVTFSSRGSGIDGKAIDKLESLISSLGLNNSKTAQFEKVPWGREGEVDYCFDLSVIENDLALNLKTKIESEFSDNKLVQVEQHENCPRKRG